MRKIILGLSTALLLTACIPNEPPPDNSGLPLHERILTLDTHIDIPLTYMKEIDPKWETDLQVDIPKLDAGHLDAGFWIVYTPQGDLTAEGYAAGLKIAETRYRAIQDFVIAYPEKVRSAQRADDVRSIVKNGKHAVLIGMENAYPLGETVENVPLWARRGVRYMGITHFGHNQFGDSSNPNPVRDDGPKWNGLSPLGKELIRAMNDNGIMVDVSHAGKQTMMQAAKISRSPIIASHSGVKAIADSARNLDDEQLREIARVGGVAQIVALDVYVKPLTAEQEVFREQVRKDMGLETSEARRNMSDAIEAEYEDRVSGIWNIEPRASVADFVDHIDHAVKVAGIDHVGIASDFDGGGGIVGWQDASETANVTDELVKRGYSEEDIAKIWGGNLLRVMEAVERGAK